MVQDSTAVIPVARVDCPFPSRALRTYSRLLAKGLDENPELNGQLGARILATITRLRLDHEELTGCGCWYTRDDRETHIRLEAKAQKFQEAISRDPEIEHAAAH